MDRFSNWLFALHGANLRDTGVRQWMAASAPLVILFCLVEGLTWFFIGVDFLQNGMPSIGNSAAYIGGAVIGILVGFFALYLDRSIFMLDLGHLKFVVWKQESARSAAQRDQLVADEMQPPSSEKRPPVVVKWTNIWLEKLTSIPLLGDALEAFFSFFRIPVLFRLVLISFTFVASVIGGYTTFGSEALKQSQFVGMLENEAKARQVRDEDLINSLQKAFEDAQKQCSNDTVLRDVEQAGTGGSRRGGAGANWERLRAAAEQSCNRAAVARQALIQLQNTAATQAAALKSGAEELRKTGVLSDPALAKQFEASKKADNYQSRFALAASEAAEAKLLIRPWSKEDWQSIKSPAQLTHFFYLIFFLGMLAVKLLQGVSTAAYYSEELQNAWADKDIRAQSGLTDSMHSYTYGFARWFYRDYPYVKKNKERDEARVLAEEYASSNLRREKQRAADERIDGLRLLVQGKNIKELRDGLSRSEKAISVASEKIEISRRALLESLQKGSKSDDIRPSINMFQSRIQEGELKLNRLEDEVARKRQEVYEYEAAVLELANADRAFLDLSERIAGAETSLQESRGAKFDAETERNNIATQIDSLRSELSATDEELGKLVTIRGTLTDAVLKGALDKEKINPLRDRRGDLFSEMQQFKTTLIKIEADQAKREAEIVRQEAQLNRLRSELEASRR